MDSIYVFKTSVNSYQDINLVNAVLHRMEGIRGWHFALDDPDNVLRVEAYNLSEAAIEEALHRLEIACIPLPDEPLP